MENKEVTFRQQVHRVLRREPSDKEMAFLSQATQTNTKLREEYKCFKLRTLPDVLHQMNVPVLQEMKKPPTFSRKEVLNVAAGRNTEVWFVQLSRAVLDPEYFPYWGTNPKIDNVVTALAKAPPGTKYIFKEFTFMRHAQNGRDDVDLSIDFMAEVNVLQELSKRDACEWLSKPLAVFRGENAIGLISKRYPYSLDRVVQDAKETS